jgi:hypothetical protein
MARSEESDFAKTSPASGEVGLTRCSWTASIEVMDGTEAWNDFSKVVRRVGVTAEVPARTSIVDGYSVSDHSR